MRPQAISDIPQQQQGIDLSGLKDIHLPDMPSFFPPSTQSLIALAVLIALFFAIRFAIRRAKLLTAKKYARGEIQRLYADFSDDPQALVLGVSSLLKRLALLKYPNSQVAALSGERWLSFLEKTSRKPLFKGDAGALLKTAQYAPKGCFSDKDTLPLIRDAEEWIVENS